MWTVLVFLGLLQCTVSSSPPSPINVSFSSVNLRNVLQWNPGSGTPEDTHFTVQYSIYGDSVEGSKRVNWRAVRQCTEIVRSWCDLSNETWDLEQGYYARVRAVSRRASSKWAWTPRRFDPKTDTTFGPPLVSVELDDVNNAIITLKGPMRYQPHNQTPAVSMATLYPQMTYNLSIDNTRLGQMHHFPVASSWYKYHLMEYNTEYCFSAKTRFFSMPAHCQSSARYCITTPQDPVIDQLRRVVVGIVVPSVCLCMLVVVGYVLYRYLSGDGQKNPYILNPPTFHPPPVTFPPENPNIIIISVVKVPQPERGISDPAGPKRPLRLALPAQGYASQGPATPPPEPEEPWDDSSYGFVGVAPQIRGEDGSNLNSDHQKCKSYEWKDEDGNSAGQTHAQREISTLVLAHAWAQPVLPSQPQAPLLSLQGAPIEKVDGGEVDREFPDLSVNTTPQMGLFRTGEIDGGAEEGSKSEEVPLLSAYASQNTTYRPIFHSDQSDILPDDYGVLLPAAAHETEEDEGNICIDWDPETRKLVLPGLDVLGQGENRMGGGEEEEKEEEEEGNSMKAELKLENVYVRQGSEERAEMERGGETEWEDRWNLVISMDE